MKFATVKVTTTETVEAVAGKPVSVGYTVVFTGTKRIWKGKIFKPWTWLRFETVSIVEPDGIDHDTIMNCRFVKTPTILNKD